MSQASDEILVSHTAAGAEVSVLVNGEVRSRTIARGARMAVSAGPLRPGDEVVAVHVFRGRRAVSLPVAVALDYPTGQFDRGRTGWNPHESDLTPGTVGTGFGRLLRIAVDGQVYAQPLVVSGLDVRPHGRLDVVFVATEADSVYAFDARGVDGAPLWHRRLVPDGERAVRAGPLSGHPDLPCDNVSPQVGITATPVVDRQTGLLYVVAYTREVGASADGGFVWRLYALDLGTGRDRVPPVVIAGSVTGRGAGSAGGLIRFAARQHLCRAALLLSRATVYVAFASHCDAAPYHGWVMAYDAETLRQKGVFNATPGGGKGGIWQSGCGPAADREGNVYVVTGNGTFGPGGAQGDFGDSVVRLRPDLSVAGFFTPHDQWLLNVLDRDLGSGGPLLLPDQSSPPRHLMVAMGKAGVVYLLDRDALGGHAGFWDRDRVPQRIPGLWGCMTPFSAPGLWGGPAYASLAEGRFVYMAGQGGRRNLVALALSGGRLSPVAATADSFPGEGGTTPVTSSRDREPGTGLVWALTRSSTILLRAYRAHDLFKVGEWEAGPWNNANGAPFNVPTVFGGRVYVGTGGDGAAAGYLAVFGRTSA